MAETFDDEHPSAEVPAELERAARVSVVAA
jgi:hypothetical protein